MLILFKKTSILYFGALFALILTCNLCAQQPGPIPTRSAPDNNQGTAPAQNSPTAPAGTVNSTPDPTTQASSQAAPQVQADSSASSALDYLFNHKPQQGSVAKEGMQANEQAKTEALAQDALGNQQIDDPII
jgi:hypothetical protein